MKKFLITILCSLLMITLFGCSNGNQKNEVVDSSQDIAEIIEENVDTNDDENEQIITDNDADSNQQQTIEANGEDEDVPSEEELKKLNSFSMLCYLAIISEQIQSSKDTRVMLEQIYNELLNDINPEAIDDLTQTHLSNLRTAIKSYMNIITKRERLQYMYNQEKAAAIRSSVPNPIGILAMANSLDWKKLALTTVYTVVDSYTNYKNASDAADNEFLMSGWELDDEQLETMQLNSERSFDYMVDMVQKYNLEGLKTLNEQSIKEFVKIKSITSPYEKIKRLVAEENTYSMLGNYWLELSDCYFETEQYDKCLQCIEKYEMLCTNLYRKDFNYVQALPKALVAAQEIYSGEDLIVYEKKVADEVIKNTSSTDWSSRFFASQIYVDLYQKTSDIDYLNYAYKYISENVACLLENQRKLNTAYLSDVKEVTIEEPDYKYLTDAEKKEKEKEYKAEKKRVKEYNNQLKENRKTELPTLYEPLVLNCEWMFALANELGIDNQEKLTIEKMLCTDSNDIFIVEPINEEFSFDNIANDYDLQVSKNEIIIPVSLLTSDSSVSITVEDSGKITTFDDVAINKVKRNDKDIDSFFAYYSSKQMKKYDWTDDSIVSISITYNDVFGKEITFKYRVSEISKSFFSKKVEFEKL